MIRVALDKCEIIEIDCDLDFESFSLESTSYIQWLLFQDKSGKCWIFNVHNVIYITVA